MDNDITKEYTNGELTIVWKPSLCTHAGVCVRTLPDVYDPKARPWISPEGADTEALKAQINKCPSGALTYYMTNEDTSDANETNTEVEVLPNGPLMIYGNIQIKNANGKTEMKTKATAFCRCGLSGNKPYCDGTHKEGGFSG